MMPNEDAVATPVAAPAVVLQAPDPSDRSAVDRAMDRYATGDEAAFETLYDALAPRLYGYLLKNTRSYSLAEDLVQQTFFHMHRARGSFIVGAAVTPWAYAIARRLFIDASRRQRREVPLSGMTEQDERTAEPSAAGARADDLMEAKDTALRFEAVLAAIPESQRTAFELVRQQGLSLAEAAEVLGTTVAAIKLRVHRAYEALRRAL